MKHGIVVYEIIDNGKILNGIFTNDSTSPYMIFSEVAIRKPEQQQIDCNSKNVVGDYKLFFRGSQGVYNGNMKIKFNK